MDAGAKEMSSNRGPTAQSWSPLRISGAGRDCDGFPHKPSLIIRDEGIPQKQCVCCRSEGGQGSGRAEYAVVATGWRVH